MARRDLIAFRVDTSERETLKALAAKLERTESDTARLAIRSLARQLDAQPDPPTPSAQRKAA
jgi:hypothetical protein